MQRIVELIYSVPEMLVVLLIATALKPILTEYVNTSSGALRGFVNVMGPNLISLFIAFGMLYWVTMSRIIRGQVLQLKQQEYVRRRPVHLVHLVSVSFVSICFRTVSDRSL